ncbi:MULTISPECIES: hypothetical protein [Burkholderia cepacia complex]|uniref:hypothetical protein n=1 Tax=Burkholderia TaxID=32008 RepID=UPI0006AC9188|nr:MULTISPECIES: hypothetical protein [Burkholderia cepacia complex]ALV61621.1 hypothetical protein TQ36_35920 [Burkholderia cenocepacia]AQQ48056.1 hypothetical protein A8F32_19490 [Burkholderia cenocepacia]KOR17689.1 hypothetical protein ABW54_30760 [Burkholderia cenocepacia]MCA7888372.1 hypothetical protein [Burkholderia contaminans]ONJ04225.1 hypothetical protein A8F33_24005 [Burkholderia cenocepacia]
MPRAKYMPTANDVLAAMRPRVAYAAYALASEFHLSAARIRPLLEAMVAQGTLSIAHVPNSRGYNVCIAGDRRTPDSPVEKYVGVPAAPRTHVVLTGDLTVYADEIKRRADLCMMVRR